MNSIIVCEKPDAAERIAKALAEKDLRRRTSRYGVDYYEFLRNDKVHIAVSAVGHLFNLKQKSIGFDYPIFDAEWVPSYEATKKSGFSERYFKTLEEIARSIDGEMISACVTPDTLIMTNPDDIERISRLENLNNKKVLGYNQFSKKIISKNIERYIRLDPKVMKKKVLKIVTESGRSISATEDHKFFTSDGWVEARKISKNDFVAVYPIRNYIEPSKDRRMILSEKCVWKVFEDISKKASKSMQSKYKYSRDEYERVINLRKKGFTHKKISLITGVKLRAVRRWLSEEKYPPMVKNNVIEQLKDNDILPLISNNKKIMAIARLLGTVFSDGCLYESRKRWYEKGFVFIGERSGGAEEVKRDLEILGFNCNEEVRLRQGKISERKFVQRSHVVYCNSLSLWLLLRALGAPTGKKSENEYEIPKWILSSSKRIQIEFLSSLFGGDLTIPIVQKKSGKCFSGTCLRFHKNEKLRLSGEKLANQIRLMLKNLGVDVTAIKIERGNIRKDGTKSVLLRLEISNSTDSLINLLNTIGIAYSSRKKFKTKIIGEYLRIKKNLGAKDIHKLNQWKRFTLKGLGNSGLLWERVSDKRFVECNDVRDLTVADIHNYIANGFLTHNCDFDNEGSLIAERIIKLIFKKEDGKRMKFSTLTNQDLINAYESMMPHLDFNNITAGETRHYLDWMYGINTSRALTLSIKKVSKRFSLLTAGRVQAPTLIILAGRELEIKNFVPTPYWQLQLVLLVDESEITALYEEDKIWNKDKAKKIFNDCKGKPAVVESIKTKKYKQYPPAPFNITSLQTEAYRLFGYSPQQAMSIAQSLYTKAYISYPRTSSEKLPPQIGYRQILEALSKIEDYKQLCEALLSKELKPLEGKFTDSAHEAIHPTVEPPENVKKLNFHEQRIYDLICKRFFSVFAQPAIRKSTQVIFNVNNYRFLTEGLRTIERGWMDFYKPYYRSDDLLLPNIKKGDILNVKSLEMLNKKTSPPPRYSQASIIKEMEKRGLGTRATRSVILQTLYDRSYIVGRSIHVSELGIKMADVIKKYVPDFADEKLTRKFENYLEKIVEGKDEKEKILKKAKKAIVKISKEFKQNEEEIGKELEEAIVKTQDEKSILGRCLSCGKDLKIIFSPKTRKYFVGCTGYKEGCKTIYPLPHNAIIYKTNKVCEKCKAPIIKVYRRGRRPFNMCLDTKCETKAGWGKSKKSTT